MSMFEEFIPDIELQANCPICEEPLSHDYYWYCSSCMISWETDGTTGKALSNEEELDNLLDDLDYS